MLDIKKITADPEIIKHKTALRCTDIDITEIIHLDSKRRTIIQNVEELKRLRNEFSKQVGMLKKEGKDTSDMQRQVKENSIIIETLDADLKETDEKLREKLLLLPNLVDDSVPVGKNENDNPVYRVWGEPAKFSFEPKAHWDIGSELGILDFERGTKVAKSRFTMITGTGARLERALINFMMDLHASRGYIEILPPYMVNPAAMTGTGQLPKFQEEAFWCERDDLYLTPTAEVPVTNLYADEILKEADLPLKFTSYSACFRREAGSYGKDVRGLIRQHQFNKVELVKFAKPEHSMFELEEMLAEAEEVLKRLNIPFRVITLCTGDIGFASAKTYDIEVWLPGQNCYREISSCSNCKDFQARRANIRYRREDGKIDFTHTLNGSGLAVGRTLVAVLENYQQADGSVVIPEALRPYMGGMERITK
ncbi:MAG: serine--tRNA ligase [Deferribacteraceae bacterium]|nr:serine--tRNA ligase [Deferribacteraceae bacterium]